MKTVTAALIVLMVFSALRGRGGVEASGVAVRQELALRAVALAALYLATVAALTLLLSATMRGHRLIDLLFEACSACGNVGLSTGVTSKLSFLGKHFLMAAMLIGRLGPPVLIASLAALPQERRKPRGYEDVLIV